VFIIGWKSPTANAEHRLSFCQTPGTWYPPAEKVNLFFKESYWINKQGMESQPFLLEENEGASCSREKKRWRGVANIQREVAGELRSDAID